MICTLLFDSTSRVRPGVFRSILKSHFNLSGNGVSIIFNNRPITSALFHLFGELNRVHNAGANFFPGNLLAMDRKLSQAQQDKLDQYQVSM